MRTSLAWPLAAVLLLGSPIRAQCALATTFVGGNLQRGNVFDVVATHDVVILGFDQNLSPGTHAIQIFTKAGSWVGFQSDASAWTLVTSPGLNVTSAAAGVGTAIPIPLPIPIAAGATRAFYVTTNLGQNLVYSNGTAVGVVAAQDQNLRVLEGAGIQGSFGAAIQPRIWNGRIRYGSGLPEFQTNQTGASLSIDNVQGTPCSKAVTNLGVCSALGATSTFQISVNAAAAGNPFDLVLTTNPTVSTSAGAFVSPHGQVLNLDLSDPTLTTAFGLAGTVPFADATIQLTASVTVNVSAQMIVFDGTSPDGAWLSQAAELHVTDAPLPPPMPGPSGDDSYETYSFAKIAFGPSSFPFYGTDRTSFCVVSNGRVMFGPPDTGYVPAPSYAAIQSPSVGAWCDLDPETGGSISVGLAALGVIRIRWIGVPYWGAPSTASTFSILLDAAVGSIVIDGLGSFQQLAGANMLLGISPGGPNATDPGSVTFSVGGPHAGPGALGMLYELGPLGSLASGVSGIVFMPNGAGNYDWSAY